MIDRSFNEHITNVYTEYADSVVDCNLYKNTPTRQELIVSSVYKNKCRGDYRTIREPLIATKVTKHLYEEHSTAV